MEACRMEFLPDASVSFSSAILYSCSLNFEKAITAVKKIRNIRNRGRIMI
jgi:hypothetical protein